jgi:hypothetical protein
MLVQISWECTPSYISTGISNLLHQAQAEVVLGQLSRYLASWVCVLARPWLECKLPGTKQKKLTNLGKIIRMCYRIPDNILCSYLRMPCEETSFHRSQRPVLIKVPDVYRYKEMFKISNICCINVFLLYIEINMYVRHYDRWCIWKCVKNVYECTVCSVVWFLLCGEFPRGQSKLWKRL